MNSMVRSKMFNKCTDSNYIVQSPSTHITRGGLSPLLPVKRRNWYKLNLVKLLVTQHEAPVTKNKGKVQPAIAWMLPGPRGRCHRRRSLQTRPHPTTSQTLRPKCCAPSILLPLLGSAQRQHNIAWPSQWALYLLRAFLNQLDTLN